MSLTLMLMLAAAKPAASLEEGMLLYHRGEYLRCLDKLDRAAVPETVEQQALVELYRGLCGFQARRPDAKSHLERALVIDPTVRLPPLVSPKIEAVFNELVARQPKPTPPPMPPAQPRPDAPVAAKLEPQPPPTNEINYGRSGVNMRTLIAPLVLAVTAVVALGLGIALGVSALDATNKGNAMEFASDAAPYDSAARGLSLGADISYGVAGLAALAAVMLFINR